VPALMSAGVRSWAGLEDEIWTSSSRPKALRWREMPGAPPDRGVSNPPAPRFHPEVLDLRCHQQPAIGNTSKVGPPKGNRVKRRSQCAGSGATQLQSGDHRARRATAESAAHMQGYDKAGAGGDPACRPPQSEGEAPHCRRPTTAAQRSEALKHPLLEPG